jgi:hypothetical protein
MGNIKNHFRSGLDAQVFEANRPAAVPRSP